MKARLLGMAQHLRESYWFLPSMMAFASVLLAGGMILLDSYQGSSWMDDFAWLYASRPDGARQVLSAIGGSMITVAGTVFSVTIAAVVYASGQYGPRLLGNFMADRGNQITLGTFIATFLYCLLVLRTIRSPEESGGAGFVPNLALLVGVALAICSIGVLIFFIHHVPSKIHINSVIEDIGERLLRHIDDSFPACGRGPADESAEPVNVSFPAAFARDTTPEAESRIYSVEASANGYVQSIDDDGLLEQAARRNVVLRIRCQAGDFVRAGRPLVDVWPGEGCDEQSSTSIRGRFAIASRRTGRQDVRFLIDELVEIAARALSTGSNDPFTAIACIDWLTAALSDLAGRGLPPHLRVDEEKTLRVIAHRVTFEQFMDRSFGALGQYAAADMIVALRFVRGLGEVSLDCEDGERLGAVAACLDNFETLTAAALTGFNLARVRAQGHQLLRLLHEPDRRRRLRDINEWLAGAA